MYLNVVIFLSLLLITFSCGDNVTNNLPEEIDPSKEIATDIRMFFTDSAITQFRLIAPIRESYVADKKLIEEYPKGVDIEFYDNEGNVTSSMNAKSATRVGVDGIMTMKDSVIMLNAAGDALKTTGILWNETNHTLKTAKFVQLIQAESRDTFYGFGFEAKDDFSQFRITQLTGKRQFEDLDKQTAPEG